VDFHLDVGHPPRRRLLSRWHRNKQLGRADGPQGHPSFRPGQLVGSRTNPPSRSTPRAAVAFTPHRLPTATADQTRRALYGCAEAKRCPFLYSTCRNGDSAGSTWTTKPTMVTIETAACSSAAIDIEDTMNVVVSYENGRQDVLLAQYLHAWEGYSVSFNGTRGRLEPSARRRLPSAETGRTGRASGQTARPIDILPHFKPGVCRRNLQPSAPWRGDRLMLQGHLRPCP